MNEMTITNAQYVNCNDRNIPINIKCDINTETLFVPLDPANRHYAEIMRQVDAGELTIADAD